MAYPSFPYKIGWKFLGWNKFFGLFKKNLKSLLVFGLFFCCFVLIFLCHGISEDPYGMLFRTKVDTIFRKAPVWKAHFYEYFLVLGNFHTSKKALDFLKYLKLNFIENGRILYLGNFVLKNLPANAS